MHIFSFHSMSLLLDVGQESVKAKGVFYILFLKIFLDPFRNIFWISVKDKAPIMPQLQISNGHFQADIQYFIIILFFHYTVNFYQVSCSFYIETTIKDDISSCMFSCRNDDLCSQNSITLYPKCSNFVSSGHSI